MNNLEKFNTFFIKYSRLICLILIVISFIISLVLGLNEIDNAKQYYKYYGTGDIFIFEKWFFIFNILITYIGLFFILFLIDMDSIIKFILVFCIIGIVLANCLLTYYFVPSTSAKSSTPTRVISILTILFVCSLFFLISRTNKYSPICYLFIVLISIINGFVATINIRQPF